MPAAQKKDEQQISVDSTRSYAEDGKRLFKAYATLRRLPKIEQQQDYSITDAIAALMHYANAQGFNAEELVTSATNHVETETIEVCPKCGKAITREWASVDYGTPGTEEEDRTFYYCSDDCKERH